MNGYNDNPMALQFVSAYRKLLHQADILISEKSNVECMGPSHILTVSSLTNRRSTLEKDINEHGNQLEIEPDDDEREIQEEFQMQLLENNSYLTDNIQDSGVAYIANLIEQRLITSSNIYCDDCRKVLLHNDKCDDKVCVSAQIERPCVSTYQLCKLTDTAIKIFINTGPTFKQKIYLMVMRNLTWEHIFPEFYEHDIDHKHFLVKFIIDEYLNKKCSYIAKQKTIQMQKVCQKCIQKSCTSYASVIARGTSLHKLSNKLYS